jgi:hypothetical protein
MILIATELNRSSLTKIADPASSGVVRENFAFFETYFSNCIEGTTFTVEVADDIVFHGQIVENRETQPPVSALRRIQRGSGVFEYARPWSEVRDQLGRCNAFQEDLRNYKLVFP